jgi:hypothetical protein
VAAQDLVGSRVAFCQEPESTRVMAPPFDDDARTVVMEEYVFGPGTIVNCVGVRLSVVFPAVGEFGDIAWAIKGTGQYLHQ